MIVFAIASVVCQRESLTAAIYILLFSERDYHHFMVYAKDLLPCQFPIIMFASWTQPEMP